MTTQEAYEAIRAYFSRPGAQFAIDENSESCKYRTWDGNKCAVGCLIPDNEYEEWMDGDTLPVMQDAALKEVLAGVPSLDGVDIQFLLEAQQAHDTTSFQGDTDRAASLAGFLVKLDKIAFNHGLTQAT